MPLTAQDIMQKIFYLRQENNTSLIIYLLFSRISLFSLYIMAAGICGIRRQKETGILLEMKRKTPLVLNLINESKREVT